MANVLVVVHDEYRGEFDHVSALSQSAPLVNPTCRLVGLSPRALVRPVDASRFDCA
jgi:hypothetical protein